MLLRQTDSPARSAPVAPCVSEELAGDATAHLSIEEAWRIVSDLYCAALTPRRVSDSGDVETELLFCLLGGSGVTFEHALSATQAVSPLRPFSDGWLEADLEEALSSLLSRPRFEPRKQDGQLRRYRFPRSKAATLVKARRWVLANGPLMELLLMFDCDRARRRFLIECPGVGLKTASWLLRNLGLGTEVAIIDIHVQRALTRTGRLADDARMPRDYELAEGVFLEWCRELDAPPAAFDLFVWDWQREAFATS